MDEICAFVATTFTRQSCGLLLEKILHTKGSHETYMMYRYAVAVKKDGNTIGHLPGIVSRVCSLFMRRGGSIHCTVSGT